MGRGIAIALALSLGANIFLGGFVAGRMLHGVSGDRPPVGDYRGEKGERGPELSDAARDKMRAAFKAHRPEFRQSMIEAKALHAEFTKVLTAETFDRAAAEDVAEKLAAYEGERRAQFTKLIIETVDGMSLEDRKALAASFAERQFGQRRSHHRRLKWKRARSRPDLAPVAPDGGEADQ
ncbi:MAG: periplasmic heavy metal sensor [Parvularculaceae bacterium]